MKKKTKQSDVVIKNWFGRESHPSDELIHWSEVNNTEAFKKYVDRLRADWDLLHANPRLAAAFERLSLASANIVHSEEAEAMAGEDL